MITAKAGAKINLVFQVDQLQPDGYHPVNSLYQELELRGEVTIETGVPGSGFSIEITTEGLPSRHISSVPKDRTNLVYKVAEYLFGRANIPLLDLSVTIHKQIPVAGGMAGGSADAAAMLLAVNEYLSREHQIAKLSDKEILEIAKEFGSDVPFSLLGGLAAGQGRGEQLTSMPALPFETNWVILISQEGLSTPSVFAKFDQIGGGTKFRDLSNIPRTVTELAEIMTNDLQEAAISLLPAVASNLKELEDLGALKAMVSGSGPTVIGLFESSELAIRAVEQLRNMGHFALTTWAGAGGAQLQR